MVQVNKQAIAAAFGRAATYYEQHAELQRQSADALLAQLDGGAFSRVLDAGCGPGRMSRYWREQGSEVCALDLSAQMLAEAQRHDVAHHYLLADIEAIPQAAATFDLAWSNLAVQWCSDLRGALSELYRVVRPGGTVAHKRQDYNRLRYHWQRTGSHLHHGYPYCPCRREYNSPSAPPSGSARHYPS